MSRATLAFLCFSLTVVLALPASAQEGDVAALQTAARAAPRDAAAQAALARALLRAGRYREADSAFRRAAGLSRNSLDALYDAARVPIEQGDYRRAQAACARLARASKVAVQTRVCNARAFLVWNRSSRAFEELEAARAAAPNDFEMLLALGDAHRLRADVANAEQAYRAAASAAPTRAEPYVGLGRLYAAANRRDDAIRVLRDALSRDAASPEVHYELGSLLGGSQEGRDLLARAVTGRANWPEAQVATGNALLAAGDGPGAERAFREAIRMNARLAEAHAGLGRAKLAQGDMPAAEASLRHALELVANSAPTVQALADVLARTDRIEDAFEQYRHAADLDPANPSALLSAARLAVEKQREVLAAGFLDRLLEAHPNLAPALAVYGDIMVGRRDSAAARDYYQRALAGTGELDRPRVEAALRALGGGSQRQGGRPHRR